MKRITAWYVVALILCAISTESVAWEERVSELWVKDSILKFILSGCDDKHFQMDSHDLDMGSAYDMLLSSLLSHKKVKVYDPDGKSISNCSTMGALVGSVRVQP